MSALSVLDRAHRTCGAKHSNHISFARSSSFGLPFSSSPGSCRRVLISCQSCVGVRSAGGFCGRSNIRRVRTDDVGQNSFSSFAFRSGYCISAGCVSSHGDICWKTASGSTSSV